jgi:carbon-monoxide dehydrogenase iron sulfur subunit
MPERLVVDLEKCTECRTCELKCSLVHFKVFNTNKAGVHILPHWPEQPGARVCIQCEDPACLPACPTGALVLTQDGNVKVIYEDCIGCESCVAACPYDGIWMDPLSNVAVKCDTCEGRFECVADCFVTALSISIGNRGE